jgi:hypothetical protein
MILPSLAIRPSQGRPAALPVRRKERGSALLVVFILLSLMVGMVMANLQTLRQLHLEMRLIEKRQLKKFDHKMVSTNQAATAGISTKKPPAETGE